MSEGNSRAADLFDLTKSAAGEYISLFHHPAEALSDLDKFTVHLGIALADGSGGEYYSPRENVWIARSAKVADSALILPPAVICEGAEVRHCAFIRGSVIVGRGAVIGNSSEVKNSVIFDSAALPHYNYCGDSIIGHRAHLGAGAVTSNLKLDRTPVTPAWEARAYNAVSKKLGALIGDRAEIGCGAVLAPGCTVGRDAAVYPLSFVRGYIPHGCIMKSGGEIVKKM